MSKSKLSLEELLSTVAIERYILDCLSGQVDSLTLSRVGILLGKSDRFESSNQLVQEVYEIIKDKDYSDKFVMDLVRKFVFRKARDISTSFDVEVLKPKGGN